MLRDCVEILSGGSKGAEPNWLRQQLFNKEGSPWQGWNLTTYQMKELLKRYGIKPKTVRAGALVWGYHLNQFEEALLKYECGVIREAGPYSPYNRNAIHDGVALIANCAV
jgi:hypothetical protein